VAADLDMDALREARRRDPALPAIVADIVRLPFRTGSIDLVWNSSTFEHLDDGGGALAEMTRVTKPGGHVFIGVPYRSGPLGFQRWIARTAVGHWIGPLFGVGQLRRLVEAAQLRAVAMRVYFFRFFVGVLAVKPAAASAEAPRGGDSV
jgi:SAM-dependent methyltransferase